MEEARQFLSPKETDVVIHHSPCDDGHAAAAIFYHKVNKDIVFFGMHPKDELLTPSVIEAITNRNVVMVDIAFSTKVITDVAKYASRLLILDHHVTNQTVLAELSIRNVKSVFVMGEAGLQLAWNYVSDEEIPRSLYFIGLKDVWKHQDNHAALCFTTAFERPKFLKDWKPVLENDDNTTETIRMGETILNYNQRVLRIMMEKVQYTEWRGYRMAIVNVPYPWISDIGAMMCEEDPEKTIAVIWNKGVSGPYSVSLRTHNPHGPNVESIALEFGGGGHVHGAGLRMDQPPYEVFC